MNSHYRFSPRMSKICTAHSFRPRRHFDILELAIPSERVKKYDTAYRLTMFIRLMPITGTEF
jgi:hypothetical protein